MHVVFLSRWLRHMPRERLLVLRTETYLGDKQQTLRQVRRAADEIVWRLPESESSMSLIHARGVRQVHQYC